MNVSKKNRAVPIEGARFFKLGFIGEQGERSGKNFLKEVFPQTPFQELLKSIDKYILFKSSWDS